MPGRWGHLKQLSSMAKRLLLQYRYWRIATNNLAELCDARYELNLEWKSGNKYVNLEMDSQIVLN